MQVTQVQFEGFRLPNHRPRDRASLPLNDVHSWGPMLGVGRQLCEAELFLVGDRHG